MVAQSGRQHVACFLYHKVILNNNLKRVKLGVAAREDLKWWANFSETFNGKKNKIYPEYELPLVSDSSLKGFAIYKGEEWLAGSWDDSLKIEYDSCGHIISSPSCDYHNKTNIMCWNYGPSSQVFEYGIQNLKVNLFFYR